MTYRNKGNMNARAELWAKVYAANASFMPEGAADAALRAYDQRFGTKFEEVDQDEEAFEKWAKDYLLHPQSGLDRACRVAWDAALAYARPL